mgnify:CR=1 FL=1
MSLLKNGSSGDDVKALQTKLGQLGFKVAVDGQYGPATTAAVKDLQGLFGYTVDGIVGPGTQQLIDQQIGYGWNLGLPDAKQRAQAAQGKVQKG